MFGDGIHTLVQQGIQQDNKAWESKFELQYENEQLNNYLTKQDIA